MGNKSGILVGLKMMLKLLETGERTLTIGAEGTVVVGLGVGVGVGVGDATVTTVVVVCAERYSVNKLCNCEDPTPKTS